MKVRLSTQALAELGVILASLHELNPSAASDLEARIRLATAQLGRFPNSGPAVAQRPGIRKLALRHFPYVLYYRVTVDAVLILRIVHGARFEPWQNL